MGSLRTGHDCHRVPLWVPPPAAACRRSSAATPTAPPSALAAAGFKSYRGRALVGAPFHPFTCVVGPNGCGKSVVVSGAGARAGALDRLVPGAWCLVPPGRRRRLQPARPSWNRWHKAVHSDTRCIPAGIAGARLCIQTPTASLLPAHTQGEAIAFALGGNASMMRARNLGSLVNHAPPAPGGRGGSPPSAAEVVLHFDVLQDAPQADPAEPAGGPAAGEWLARAGGGSGGSEAAAGAQPSVVGRLLVRRRVTRGGRSSFAVQQAAQPPEQQQHGKPVAGSMQACSSGSSGGSGGGSSGEGQWRAATPASLRELLAPYGLQTEAVDRLVLLRGGAAAAARALASSPQRAARLAAHLATRECVPAHPPAAHSHPPLHHPAGMW